jgi:choice-of-anchor A domain-containing protein
MVLKRNQMTASIKTAVSAVVLAIAAIGSAHAAMLDLNKTIGGANVYSLTNFTAPSADVQGAIVAAGNVSLSHYTTNLNNQDAFGHYSLIAGGSLTYNGGDILNGDTYVGTTSKLSSMSIYSPVKSGTAPVYFDKVSSMMKTASSELSAIKSTAAVTDKWNGIFLSGSNKSVEVINLSATELKNATYYNLSGFAKDATLIVNVSGSTAQLQGDYSAFDAYNVVFNFASASTLNIGTGANVSILAPLASVSGGSGVIQGSVIVKSWNSQVQINSGNAFEATMVNGLVTTIPEPGTYAMLLAGLGMVGFMARRRQKAAPLALPAR